MTSMITFVPSATSLKKCATNSLKPEKVTEPLWTY